MPGASRKRLTEATGLDGNAISFVTANGYLPYTDESLGNRGLFTHLVATAMMRADPEQRWKSPL